MCPIFVGSVHNFGKWQWHYLVEKYLFLIDALVVWCPTWSKIFGRTLMYIILTSLRRWTVQCCTNVSIQVIFCIFKLLGRCQSINCRSFPKSLNKIYSYISFNSSNTQFYKSRIFSLFTFWVFFPDKSFKLISKYTVLHIFRQVLFGKPR